MSQTGTGRVAVAAEPDVGLQRLNAEGRPWARRYYDQQRGRGNDHHAALRSLAFKWMRILFRCWQTRTPYDEATYLEALRRHGSPLVAQIT